MLLKVDKRVNAQVQFWYFTFTTPDSQLAILLADLVEV